MSKEGLVAIVGRPNVGKSTLFNRLVGGRVAIVDEKSGVTRDRHYGEAEWNGVRFPVIDTGGYSHDEGDELQEEIRKQVEQAVQDASLLLFVLDVKTGITDLEDTFAKMLRKSGKPVLVVANKVDGPQWQPATAEFYSLGLGELYPISSSNGSGTGELLDEVVRRIPGSRGSGHEELLHLAIVGKPNVGKSSLLNTITGEYRSVVSEKAGTTRDTIDMRFKGFGFDLVLVDTAGLRKKGKIREDLEYYADLRAIRSIERSDVCLLLLDAEEGLQRQDLNIITRVEREGKGLVILVNKWDRIEKDASTAHHYERAIRQRIPQLGDLPILFTSVIEKKRLQKALEEAVQVGEERRKQISTHELNEWLLGLIERDPPPMDRGKRVRIKYVHQLPGPTPAFVFHCNRPGSIKKPYKRFLEKQIRSRYGFKGVPVRLFFRKK
ncbi:MAG: ribosome biogenesis GTPase Der [Flavobacteriales bacterium]